MDELPDDVYGLDAQGKKVLMNEDFAIAPALDSDGVDFLLETSPVTSSQSLTILRDVTDTSANGGLEQFGDKLKQAEMNIVPIVDYTARLVGEMIGGGRQQKVNGNG